MSDAAAYSATETLRDGRRVEIRAFRLEDRDALLAAVDKTSARSLYLRFFTVKRGFTEREMAFFLNVDFVRHVAVVALMEEAGRAVIVAGGRYVVVAEGIAEVAFVVVDKYQGLGLGAALLRHLAAIARAAGLRELIADVLAENKAMLRVFENSGFPMTAAGEAEVTHVTLRLA